MKTFHQFRIEQKESLLSLVVEAQGFKIEPSTKKKKKKTVVDARSEKIQLLKKRSGGDGKKVLWRGLEGYEHHLTVSTLLWFLDK